MMTSVQKKIGIGFITLLAVAVSSFWAGICYKFNKTFFTLPVLDFNEKVLFDSKIVRFSGWSSPEAGFRWSDGKTSKIIMNLGTEFPKSNVILLIDVKIVHDKQSIDVYVNEKRIGAMRVSKPGIYHLPIAREFLVSGENKIRFVFSNPSSVPGDTRLLGMGIGWFMVSTESS